MWCQKLIARIALGEKAEKTYKILHFTKWKMLTPQHQLPVHYAALNSLHAYTAKIFVFLHFSPLNRTKVSKICCFSIGIWGVQIGTMNG